MAYLGLSPTLEMSTSDTCEYEYSLEFSEEVLVLDLYSSVRVLADFSGPILILAVRVPIQAASTREYIKPHARRTVAAPCRRHVLASTHHFRVTAAAVVVAVTIVNGCWLRLHRRRIVGVMFDLPCCCHSSIVMVDPSLMGRRPGFVVVVRLATHWLFATSAIVAAQVNVVVVVVVVGWLCFASYMRTSPQAGPSHVHLCQYHHQQQQDGGDSDDNAMMTTERRPSTTAMGTHQPRPWGGANNSKTAAASLGRHNHDHNHDHDHHHHHHHDGVMPVDSLCNSAYLPMAVRTILWLRPKTKNWRIN
ncbi:hypothetical protein EDB89DRAFT_1907627 [Lactarius sanguifluus]|nr:hypothetical protein EDB89DRAFT_1907627 [Lactarius sanguifluus]